MKDNSTKFEGIGPTFYYYVVTLQKIDEIAELSEDNSELRAT